MKCRVDLYPDENCSLAMRKECAIAIDDKDAENRYQRWLDMIASAYPDHFITPISWVEIPEDHDDYEKLRESTGFICPNDGESDSEESTGFICPNDGESDSDWSDRVEYGEYDPVTDTVQPR